MKMSKHIRFAVALMFAPLLGACEGDNLFDGTSPSTGNPIVTGIGLLRTTVPQCGNIDVSVSASGPRPLQMLTVMLRFDTVGGADQTEEVTLGSTSNVIPGQVVSFVAANAGSARVLAFVTDDAGNVSPLAEAGATVTITPAPAGTTCSP
jgi:hypothetical protein